MPREDGVILVGNYFLVKNGLPKCLIYTNAIYNSIFRDFKLGFIIKFEAERAKFQTKEKLQLEKAF